MNYLKLRLLALGIVISIISQAQLPKEVLVGYWHNWETLRLKDINDSYNVLVLSFLEADKNNLQDDNKVSDLEFTPKNSITLKQDITTVKAEGKKVIVSIGGANGSFKLNSISDKNIFVTKIKDFIISYKVDGIDLDLERSVYMCPSVNQTITNPAPQWDYIIDAVKELQTWFKDKYSKKMILTMAPEVKYTTGGLSPWNDCNGSWLPIIESLRNEIDLLMIQLYNSSENYSLPGYEAWPANSKLYNQGTADYIITQVEAAIEGFKNQGNKTTGTYSGLPASKIVIALPASSCSAGSGYIATSTLKAAAKYLLGVGSKPGTYTLSKSYPELRGFMTWSANNDADACGGSYSFAQAFNDVYDNYDNANSIKFVEIKNLSVYPNPTTGILNIESEKIIGQIVNLTDLNGRIVLTQLITEDITSINTALLSKGIYTINAINYVAKVILK